MKKIIMMNNFEYNPFHYLLIKKWEKNRVGPKKSNKRVLTVLNNPRQSVERNPLT